MKHAVEFRDPRVQALAEGLFSEEQLRYMAVSRVVPMVPMSQEARDVFAKQLAEAEKDLVRGRNLLALADMAVTLNGGSYEGLLKYRDQEEQS